MIVQGMQIFLFTSALFLIVCIEDVELTALESVTR